MKWNVCKNQANIFLRIFNNKMELVFGVKGKNKRTKYFAQFNIIIKYSQVSVKNLVEVNLSCHQTCGFSDSCCHLLLVNMAPHIDYQDRETKSLNEKKYKICPKNSVNCLLTKLLTIFAK